MIENFKKITLPLDVSTLKGFKQVVEIALDGRSNMNPLEVIDLLTALSHVEREIGRMEEFSSFPKE